MCTQIAKTDTFNLEKSDDCRKFLGFAQSGVKCPAHKGTEFYALSINLSPERFDPLLWFHTYQGENTRRI